MHASRKPVHKGSFALALTLAAVLGTGAPGSGLAADGHAVTGHGAAPAPEAKSKKTGKRKPREIVVVGSGANAQTGLTSTSGNVSTNSTGFTITPPALPSRRAEQRPGARANPPHDRIHTGNTLAAPKANARRGTGDAGRSGSNFNSDKPRPSPYYGGYGYGYPPPAAVTTPRNPAPADPPRGRSPGSP